MKKVKNNNIFCRIMMMVALGGTGIFYYFDAAWAVEEAPKLIDLSGLDKLRDPFQPRLPSKKEAQATPKSKQKLPVARKTGASKQNRASLAPAIAPKKIIPAQKKQRAQKKTRLEKQVKVPEVRLPAMKVTGVMWSEDNPMAIINNQIVEVGESILGVKIVGITTEEVKVTFKEKDFNLTVE